MSELLIDRNVPWVKKSFKDVATFLNGRAYKAEEFKEYGIPIVRIQNLTGEGNTVYSDLDLPEDKCINYGDLIYAWSASFGPYIWKGPKSIYHYHIWKILCKEAELDKHFFYYYLSHVSDTLKDSGNGTLFIHITKSLMESFELNLPPLKEQKVIASILCSLDDKIDLLRRQNATLERMAETLFRLWFEEEAQDSNVGQFIDLQNGYAFKSQDFKDIGEQRVLKIKNISGGIIDVNNTDFIDSAVANKTDAKFKVVTGDILFAMTGAEIGKLGIVPKTNTPLWLNQRVGLLKEKFKGARFLAYLQLNSDIGQDYIENSATGSAQPNISGSLIEQCPFPKVEVSRIKECAEILDVYYQKLISNLGQIQTLEKLRDNLLPKLMSGEVRIKMEGASA